MFLFEISYEQSAISAAADDDGVAAAVSTGMALKMANCSRTYFQLDSVQELDLLASDRRFVASLAWKAIAVPAICQECG